MSAGLCCLTRYVSNVIMRVILTFDKARASLKSIIYIADPEIISIPIIECHEAMIDVKDQAELQYGSPPETPLTAPHYTLMRKTVYDKLCLSQKDLPPGWRFRLYEAFRSIEVQQMLFDEEYKLTAKRLSAHSHAEIFHETTRLVSPVINFDGSVNIPPHNTGAAVDVELLDGDGQVVDMGMEAKDCIFVDPELCMTDYPVLDSAIKKNRRILCDIMEAHGFVNYPTEWWHYSYGDRYWAYHKNQPHAIYGSYTMG